MNRNNFQPFFLGTLAGLSAAGTAVGLTALWLDFLDPAVSTWLARRQLTPEERTTVDRLHAEARAAADRLAAAGRERQEREDAENTAIMSGFAPGLLHGQAVRVPADLSLDRLVSEIEATAAQLDALPDPERWTQGTAHISALLAEWRTRATWDARIRLTTVDRMRLDVAKTRIADATSGHLWLARVPVSVWAH